MSPNLPAKIIEQMNNAGLPTGGVCPFEPRVITNRSGVAIIDKQTVRKGPRKSKKGYVDTQGRIWIKDKAHAEMPDHWDVQIDGGENYFRVDLNGELLS